MRQTPWIAGILATLLAAPASAQTYLDDRSGPEALVRSLYNAIERGEYARAFGYFAEPPAANLEEYREGYAGTSNVDVLIGAAAEEGAAGSLYFEQPVVIRAETTTEGETIYAGCYSLRRSNMGAAEDAFAPLAIVEANLAPIDGAFGEESLPRRCGDDGADLPETDLALARATRIYDTVYEQRCLLRPGDDEEVESHDIDFRYMHETADDAMRTARLFRFPCNRGAYNETHVYFLDDGDGVAPLGFATPELDIRYQDDDLEGDVESITPIGYITRLELVNSSYDASSQTLTSWEKWRGLGDAAALGRWIFRYGTFSLVGYEVDASYDGEINPEPVLEFGAP